MNPRFLRQLLEEMLRRQIADGGGGPADFLEPAGEPALVATDSVSWRVFNNPVSLVIGGIAAVILELAEPRIRTGVWEHTTFRTDPLKRMRRTGVAAMITVYAARSRATRLIGHVGKMHDLVRGTTPDGIPYHANDPELLRWVHATAAFGFLEAYHRHVRPLSTGERDRFFAEGVPVARLYGATDPPGTETDWEALVTTMTSKLEPSPILSEFLSIMHRLPLLPGPLRAFNRLFVNAAVDLLPEAIRDRLEIRSTRFPGSSTLLRIAARQAEKLELASSPLSLAKLRTAAPKSGIDR